MDIGESIGRKPPSDPILVCLRVYFTFRQRLCYAGCMFAVSLFLTLLLCAMLCASGWIISRRVLRLQDDIAVMGMGMVLGLALFLILSNALGYLLPVYWSFLSAFVVVVVVAIGSFLLPPSPELRKAPRSVWWALGIAGLLIGFATARFLTTDLWTWSQLPISATVMAGNFPIREPVNPWAIVGYHYGPQFLAAGFSLLTGASLAVSYNAQPFFGAIGALFLAASLIRLMGRSWRGSILGSVLLFGGSGFQWIRGFRLFTDFLDPAAHPLRAFAEMYGNTFGASLLIVFGSRTYTLGLPFFIACLLCLHQAWSASLLRLRMAWTIAFIPLALGLALTAETSFVLLYPAIALFFVWTWMDRQVIGQAFPWRHLVAVGFIGMIPAGIFALLQGGVLTSALQGGQGGPASFALNDGRFVDYLPLVRKIGFWEAAFLRSVGLPFFLFPIVMIFIWNKRREYSFVFFVALLAFLHLVVPFVIEYVPRQNEMNRILHMALALSSMLVGFMLARTWLMSIVRWKRIISYVIVFSMLCSSTVYLVLRLIMPTMRWEVSPLFAKMPIATPAEMEMYKWAKQNTTLEDFFYSKTMDVDPLLAPPLGQQHLSEEELQQRDRLLFMSHAQRFNVGFLQWGNVSERHRALERSIESTCSIASFKAHTIRYLVVTNAERAAWFKSVCDVLKWTLVYDGGEQGRDHPRVYEIRVDQAMESS